VGIVEVRDPHTFADHEFFIVNFDTYVTGGFNNPAHWRSQEEWSVLSELITVCSSWYYCVSESQPDICFSVTSSHYITAIFIGHPPHHSAIGEMGQPTSSREQC
jgi:hypothetical protein